MIKKNKLEKNSPKSTGLCKKGINNLLGPVEDLESYVKADWWMHLFNSNYLKTDCDVVMDDTLTVGEVDTILNILPINKSDTVLDLCCGQGRHVVNMARRGFSALHGFDRSHYLISKARKLNIAEGLGISFKEGDARKLPYRDNQFDFIMLLGNSFGYFESERDDMLVLKEVNRILKPNGKLLIDITDGSFMMEHFEPRSWEWINKTHFVCRERSLSKDKARLITREVITHSRKGIIADQFYAERLYQKAEIIQLLKKSNFTSCEIKKEFNTESQKNHDMGMMGRRILAIGTADKKVLPSIKSNNIPIEIAVLMGDPRMQDIVKPGAQFDNDDMYTIQRLKDALYSLKEYKFTFFDNHKTLFRDLNVISSRFQLVFNLCDEGFNNDPLKELHIPALLEMAGIPYTGGNPQCLAYCYDKSLIRGIAAEMDIPVPEASLVKPEDIAFISMKLEFPVIVKPNFGDSSFGITSSNVCYNIESLEASIHHIREQFGYQNPILIESFLTGKDISVGIIGNPPNSFSTLPIIEEDYSALPDGLPRICGYEAKWDPTSPYWGIKSIPADLPEETQGFLRASCLKLFERLDCRDYARFDWRLDANNTPRLLEVNPNPGWCWDGHLAKMCAIKDTSYTKMLSKIIKSALLRYKINTNEKVTINTSEPIESEYAQIA